MPLREANKPSRRHILAAERKRHGAYDPVRLAKPQTPQKLGFRRRVRKHAASDVDAQAASRSPLEKREGATSSTSSGTSIPNDPVLAASMVNTTTTSPSAAATDDQDSSSSLPGTIPQINYGDASAGAAASANNPPSPMEAGTMHNDTPSPPSVDQKQDLVTASTTSSGSKLTDDNDSMMNGGTIGLIVGAVIIVAVLIAIGFFVRRHRQFPRFSSKTSSKRTKAQRLGSIDGLRCVSSHSSRHDKAPLEACEDKFGSRNSLLVAPVSPSRAGPFDRAISNILSTPSPPQVKLDIKTNTFLSVPPSGGAGLHHQRSLDSIAEVQEPPTSADQPRFDSTPPKRLTWTDRLQQPSRPTTAPGGESGRSLGSPPSSYSKKSPPRPQSAKGVGSDIEMTRQGSTLVIRNRPSTATLRRPLSSAGSSFRSALRKTRGEGEEEAICIETDGIVGDTRPMTSPTTSTDGVYDVQIPTVTVDKSQLRSHFSATTKSQRGSYATFTTTSPSGSFSFEIKDAVRLRAPITLDSTVAGGAGGEREKEAESTVQPANTAGASVESFVRDMDWDLGDCGLTCDDRWVPTSPALAKNGETGKTAATTTTTESK